MNSKEIDLSDSHKNTDTENTSYTPPKVWQWQNAEDKDHGGKFSSINRPTAGARHAQTLPQGKNPLQLYSLNTPNGLKINIMLEELASLGIQEASYDAFLINIGEGDQFGSDFVAINPNSKIPALVDNSTTPPTKVFESGAILLYLAEKHLALMPNKTDVQNHTACMSWLMWQMGSAPYLGGGFGHFYNYAPYPMEYPINRFTMEVKRQLDVLNQHFANNDYLCSSGYSIADIAVWPWYGMLVLDKKYGEAGTFLDVASYEHVLAWAKRIESRPAVQRALELKLNPIK